MVESFILLAFLTCADSQEIAAGIKNVEVMTEAEKLEVWEVVQEFAPEGCYLGIPPGDESKPR